MNFVVSDQVDEVLIGVDWMRDHQCLLSFVDFTITLRGYRFPILKMKDGKASNQIIWKEEVLQPTRPETMCVGRVLSVNGVFPKKSSELTGARLQTTEDKPCQVNKLRCCNFVGSTKGCVKISCVRSCSLQEPSDEV